MTTNVCGGYYLCMDDAWCSITACAWVTAEVNLCVDDGVQILHVRGLLQRSTCAWMIRSVQISKLKPWWWWWRWSNRHRSRRYFAATLIAGNLCDVSTGRCVISLMAAHHYQLVAG